MKINRRMRAVEPSAFVDLTTNDEAMDISTATAILSSRFIAAPTFSSTSDSADLSAMYPLPGLLSCPNEVLAHILSSEELNKNDLKALRLVCKELHPASTREFAQRYLTEPFFILSNYSLNAMVQICKHPLFRPHVKSIGFLTTMLKPSCILTHARDFESAVVSRHSSQARSRLTILNRYYDLCAEQLQLESSDEAAKLIGTALSSLDHPVTIALADSLDGIRTIGTKRVPSSFYHNSSMGSRQIDEVSSRMRTFSEMIQNAISQIGRDAQKRFTGLKISMRSYMNASGENVIDFQRVADGYTYLVSLHLDIDFRSMRCSVSLPSLEGFFEAASNLQEFTLSANWGSRDGTGPSLLKNTAKWLKLPAISKLKKLVLRGACFSLEVLLSLMKHHANTLREVKLENVVLLGTWELCFKWMDDNLDLDHLHLQKLYTIDERIKKGNGQYRPSSYKLASISIVGKHSVHIALKSRF